MFWVIRLGRGRLAALLGAALLIAGAALWHWALPVLHRLGGPLAGTVVVIDPGHGGVDGGASWGDVLEKEINLAVAKELAHRLHAEGARAVLTRNEDEELSHLYADERTRQRRDLSARARIGWEEGADLLISLHSNWAGSPDIGGAVTFFQPSCELSRRAAQKVQRALEQVIPGNQNDTLPRHFFLLDRAACPAILVEMGFLSNAEDRRRLIDPRMQGVIADAIAAGIGAHLASERADSPV